MSDTLGLAPFTSILGDVLRADTLDFRSAWIGMEPTFSNKKTLKLWRKNAATEEAETEFFWHRYTLGMEKAVAKAMREKYRDARKRGDDWCLFDEVERERDLDQWGAPRQNLHFRCKGDDHVFTVRFGLDPETYEFSIKPVPLLWLYDARFVRFLQEIVWDVPQELGLRPSIAHGGCQFSLSAKTYLSGSLLADTLCDRFNHPELACWIFDYPNCDDRSLRATPRRREAFLRIFEQYWAGAFHPRAIGQLCVENALLDYGFGPAAQPPPGLMSEAGPVGSQDEIFQTNFAFARAVRLLAQNVHPGYWQSAHPDSLGYRPDQIMRYSETNLNRLRIRGEYHVKSGEVLQKDAVPPLSAALNHTMLYDEASFEVRAQYGCTSARDFVESALLEVHRAQYLQRHPQVKPTLRVLHDPLLADAEQTLLRLGAHDRLQALRSEAYDWNRQTSLGRIQSDFVEPETLFWEVWQRLPLREQALIAREALGGLIERVTQAATCDPRRSEPATTPVEAAALDAEADPMEWHRHRVHPILWQVLKADPAVLASDEDEPLRRELARFHVDPDRYLTRRPTWSLRNLPEPWQPPAQRG
ncbi:MAG: hypothetical protein JNJ46_27045 [Myxococcales bacterium]|nr:hypothetical protein [Myxococcales bacterium]